MKNNLKTEANDMKTNLKKAHRATPTIDKMTRIEQQKHIRELTREIDDMKSKFRIDI